MKKENLLQIRGLSFQMIQSKEQRFSGAPRETLNQGSKVHDYLASPIH